MKARFLSYDAGRLQGKATKKTFPCGMVSEFFFILQNCLKTIQLLNLSWVPLKNLEQLLLLLLCTHYTIENIQLWQSIGSTVKLVLKKLSLLPIHGVHILAALGEVSPFLNVSEKSRTSLQHPWQHLHYIP